jgi:hypothetical protein
MSEPSETNGHPLTPTTTKQEQLQPEGNTINSSSASSASLSTHARHHKSPQSLDDYSKASKSTNPRRRPGTTIKTPSGPHAGSSRSEKKLTTSPTKMMSQSSSVHYTRTGRVSKAKKGLKVHNCECGRSYTRAEHLRRHQKNHAQEDALVCDYPDCGRSFYRVDLLHRHQERHNEPTKDHHDSPDSSTAGSPEARQPQVSVTIPLSIGPKTLPITQTHYPHHPISPMRETGTIPSDKHSNYMERQSMGVPVGIGGMTPPMGWTEPYRQSPDYSSSSGYASPNLGPGDYPHLFASLPYGHAASRTRTSSIASFNEPWAYTPRSPTSTNPTTLHTWASNDSMPTSQGLAYMGTSYPMGGLPISTSIDSMASYGPFSQKTMMQRDEDECVILFPEQAYGSFIPLSPSSIDLPLSA